MPASYFVIVAKEDQPIYELELAGGAKKEDQSQLKQFILHSSLDVVDELQWTSSNLYFKSIDKFSDYTISAFVTAGYVRFLLLHEGEKKNEDGVKTFMNEVYELYVKIQLNPFYKSGTLINSKHFDLKVKQLAAKYIP